MRQNFSPVGFAWPQAVQLNDCMLSDTLHSPQKVAPGGFLWPQAMERTVFSVVSCSCGLRWPVNVNTLIATPPLLAPIKSRCVTFLYRFASCSAALNSAVRYSLNSFSDWKWLVRPDTRCSTRPAAYA